LLLLNAFTRLSNCSLVIDVEHSAVLGTLVLVATFVSAGHRPFTLITGWFGGTSAGFSSRFSSEGGVAWVAGDADGVAAGGCFEGGFCGFWAAAVTAKRMQMIRLRVIVQVLSRFKGVRRQYPSIMVFRRMQATRMVTGVLEPKLETMLVCPPLS
jgi:hypothetical protein